MAVKQKVIGCVASPTEGQLQLILRALQDIPARDGNKVATYIQIVTGLGAIAVPSDPAIYMKFIEDIKVIQNMLVKQCTSKELISVTWRALYGEISNPAKNPSPVMSIVLQLIDMESVPGAVKFILNKSYTEQNLERALYVLCNWLTKWTWTENLGPLVLSVMKSLESEQHYDMLVDVSLSTIEPLFKLLILPTSRYSVWPVVHYMLTRIQHDPRAFHKIVPHIPKLIKIVEKEESGHLFLEQLVHLFLALMEHFSGYQELYGSLPRILEPYSVKGKYKVGLNCQPWAGRINAIVPVQSVGKVGLYNLGNTCYMNSILQALFMTKIFRNEILLHNKQMMPLFEKVQTLFALLQHSKKPSLSPNEIVLLLRPLGFVLGHQHDSSEFLGYLLDTLHEQEKSGASGGADDSEGGSVSADLSPTIVQQMFGGKTVTVSRCADCGTRSEKIDNFRELQLSFPNSGGDQSVQDLMDYFLQPEKLSGDNQYRCDVCDQLTDGERITKVVEAPTHLILTLKHFRYDPTSQTRTKLLQTFKLDNRIRLEGAQFDLYAAVVHCGTSVDSGHYYTFAKENSEWYKFNDSAVRKASADELHYLKPPETPYILFYSQEGVSEPENLPCTVLSSGLQLVLSKDHSEAEIESKQSTVNRNYSTRRQNSNDDPPPPGCGGEGFSSVANNMFVC